MAGAFLAGLFFTAGVLGSGASASTAATAACRSTSMASTIPSVTSSTSGAMSGQAITPMSMLPMLDNTVMFNPDPSINGPNGYMPTSWAPAM